MINIDKYAQEIYAWNKQVGWWDEGDNRCLFTCLQLISTEVAEATEGFRKDLMDDHLPHRKMEEVELADALIRTLDLGGYWMSKYPNFKFKPLYLKGHMYTRTHNTKGKQLLGINHDIINLSHSLLNTVIKSSAAYSELVLSIIAVANNSGYDIETAMVEKMEYNKHRLDHKRENREKEGGKKI